MRLSSRGHYGLRAMTELANSFGHGPVALTEIAEQENLSVAYLEQLFSALKKFGLVESTRGVKGGYELTREPSLVSVGEIVRALEGPIAPVECASEVGNSGCCEREGKCASQQVWQRMRDSIAGVLDSMTLADLCREDQQTILH